MYFQCWFSVLVLFLDKNCADDSKKKTTKENESSSDNLKSDKAVKDLKVGHCEIGKWGIIMSGKIKLIYKEIKLCSNQHHCIKQCM